MRKIIRKFPNTWKLDNILINHSQFKKKKKKGNLKVVKKYTILKKIKVQNIKIWDDPKAIH